MNLKHPKVSILMPSLNSGAFVRECVESVVNQTLREIEILCVDAGSPSPSFLWYRDSC